jgi:hypothetical protein
LGLAVEGFGLDPARLHATVFGGDEQVGADVAVRRAVGPRA